MSIPERVTAYNVEHRAEEITPNGYSDTRNNSQTRWNAITSVNLSGTVYQAVCFWNSDSELVLGKRILDGAWTFYNYPAITVAGDDNHDTISVGLDPNGYLHVCYGMHIQPLIYKKSDASINAWTSGLTGTSSMLGTNETEVTYPVFVNDPSGNLYFLFRDGGAASGDLYMYKYNHISETWLGVSGTVAGKLIDGKSDSLGEYWEHPCFDDDFGSGGYLHLGFHFRSDTSNSNKSKSYAKWDGINWKKSDGSSQTVPIRIGNAEVVDSDGVVNTGMTSFNTLYSDSNGNPHLVYPKTGADGYRHIYHAYHNGTSWTISQVTITSNPVVTDISDFVDLIPAIAIDRSTNTLYVLHIDRTEGDELQLAKSTNFTTWKFRRVYSHSLGSWTPKYDYVEFERSGILYIPMEVYYGVILVGNQSKLPIYVWKVDPSKWK